MINAFLSTRHASSENAAVAKRVKSKIGEEASHELAHVENTASVNSRAEPLVAPHFFIAASSLQSAKIADLATPPQAFLLFLFTITSVISHPCLHLQLALQTLL